MAPRSSITKRWLLNSFGIIVVIMVAMVIGVSAAMHSFYYNSACLLYTSPSPRD